MVEQSLVFIRQDGIPHYSVLLGEKRRGQGVGLVNGFGGKPKKRESILDCAIRETKEECGIIPVDLVKKAEVIIPSNPQNQTPTLLHCFVATEWEGQKTKTKEMDPRWYTQFEIPYDKMWPSNEVWLPLILAGVSLRTTLEYNQQEFVGYKVDEVREF